MLSRREFDMHGQSPWREGEAEEGRPDEVGGTGWFRHAAASRDMPIYRTTPIAAGDIDDPPRCCRGGNSTCTGKARGGKGRPRRAAPTRSGEPAGSVREPRGKTCRSIQQSLITAADVVPPRLIPVGASLGG